jgi:hypothetical protein
LGLQNASHLHKSTQRGLEEYQPEGLSENFNKHQLERTVAGGEGKKNYPTRR